MYNINHQMNNYPQAVAPINPYYMPHPMMQHMNPMQDEGTIKLIRDMDNVWEQHVFWTRMVILSILLNLPMKNEAVKRLLQNPGDMAEIFGRYYPVQVKNKISELFTQHLTIGAQVITAVGANEGDKVTSELKKWYQNGDEIAKYLSSINRAYDYETLKRMFFTHLDLTRDDVLAVHQGMFAKDVELFDRIENEALMMSKYFVEGLLRK